MGLPLRHLLRDVRYSVRGLRRTPLFAGVALVSLALGIGANSAVFSFVDQVLLRRLPVPDPGRLVLFTQVGSHYGSNRGGNATSYPMYEDFREAFVDHAVVPPLPRVSTPYDMAPVRPIFSGLFSRFSMPVNVGVAGRAERVQGELVSGAYFQVLGVGAAVGRVITPADNDTRGANPVAVLSYEYWRNRFGADPHVVGAKITVNDYPFTIIGVSQQGFDGLDIANLAGVRVPMTMKAQVSPQWDDLDNRRSRWVNVFGRLKPGISRAAAQAALQPYFHALRQAEEQEPAFRNASVYAREQFLKGNLELLPAARGRSFLRQRLTRPLWLLMGTVGFVLLIACANVASLLIARGAARQKEIAVRLALGATRARIVGQLLTESLLLALAGGAAGLLVAGWTARFLLGYLTAGDMPHDISAALDHRVLAFTFAVALGTGVVFGLVPALRSTRPDVAPTLKDEVGSVVGGGVGLRKALVVAQVTLSVLLLVGAGLFVRSLRNLRLVDLGIQPASLVRFSIDPSVSGYSPVRTKQFYLELLDRLRAQPEVADAGFAMMGLLEGNEWDSSMTIAGYAAKPGEDMQAYCNAVSPEYFTTMGIRLVDGRDFDRRDALLTPTEFSTNKPPAYRVAIVNESFAKHYFGDANPIGRHMGFGSDPGTKTPIEIVGVVADAKYTDVRDDVQRQAFFPYLQGDFAGFATVYVRSRLSPDAAFAAGRRVVRQIDANVPIFTLRTEEDQIDQSLLNERMVATLAAVFSLLATMLAMIGLYGVMAYTVARRTREIGLRVALGAARGDVIWLVMREVLVLVGLGVGLGLAASFGLTRIVRGQLFGVAPNDPMTIAAAAAVLALVGVAAGYLPARRATRIDPALALRYE